MSSRNAKELCAMLITRSLQDLTEDEEEIVVDYLEKLRIRTTVNMKPKQLCTLLLEKIIEKEYPTSKPPITAYAHQLLQKETITTTEKQKIIKTEDVKIRRSRSQKDLENMAQKLPGCSVSQANIFGRNLYELRLHPEVGIVNLNDETSQYTAVISVSLDLYEKIFLANETPIIEIKTNKGSRAYAKIALPHEESDNIIYISPLVALILNIQDVGYAFLQLCTSLPEIAHVKFTFYGTQEELNQILKDLIVKLPSVINAFSYLSLGMVLNTNINGKQVEVRVDSLTDDRDRPVFSGLLPFQESDLPFDIVPDL